MAGDKTYITDDQGKQHRATRVHAVTPTNIVWSSNPNDYAVQVLIDGKWHRAILTYDVSGASYFDNVNIDKALVVGADGKNHTALIVSSEAAVTLSSIKTDEHALVDGTTTGETAVCTYTEAWGNIEWEDNVNVYKVIVTGSDGKKHTALLTTGANGGVQAIVTGVAPLVLPDALATSIVSLIAFGGTEQSGTPTPNAPVDIVTNNGAIKNSPNLLDPTKIMVGYYRVAGTGVLTESPYNWAYDGFMPVTPGAKYMFYGRRRGNNHLSAYNRIHWYNSDFEFIGTNSYTINTIGTGTAPSNAAYATVSCNESGGTQVVTTDEIVAEYDWVFELGTTESQYIPYSAVNPYTSGPTETIAIKDDQNTTVSTATAEMLLSLLGYTDQQEIITGGITKKVGITVFDGTESWSRATNQDGSANYVFYTQIDGKKIGNNMPMLCTHYAYIGSASYVTLTTGKFLSNAANNSVYFDGGSITTVTNWKNWLTDQYRAGTPVIAIYPLATETTETVAGQPMQTADGDNTAEITQAGMDGLELEVTYMKQGS